jgi:hypothetical protein
LAAVAVLPPLAALITVTVLPPRTALIVVAVLPPLAALVAVAAALAPLTALITMTALAALSTGAISPRRGSVFGVSDHGQEKRDQKQKAIQGRRIDRT